MKRSESINELAAALAKAQSQMEGASKDSNNPFFGSKYADLAACWAAWRPAGPPNGLALMQFATATEERLDPPIQVQGDDSRKAKTIHFIQRVSVETLLCHASGQWVSEILTVLVKDDSPQSTILGETYCRRGGMSAVTGIAPEDDDGDAAANHGAESGERRTQKAAPKPDCPNCENKSKFVYEDRQKGGFFCWKQKGGCGHNWLPEQEQKDVQGLLESGQLTTGDKVEQPASVYPAAKETLGKYTKVSELITFAGWVKAERIKKTLTAAEYADLDSKIASKAVEFPSNDKGFEAAEKLLRSLHHEMRISEGDYLAVCGKLADAKDSKLAGAAA